MIKRFIDRQGSATKLHRILCHILCIPYDFKLRWHIKGIIRELTGK